MNRRTTLPGTLAVTLAAPIAVSAAVSNCNDGCNKKIAAAQGSGASSAAPRFF